MMVRSYLLNLKRLSLRTEGAGFASCAGEVSSVVGAGDMIIASS